MIENISEHPPPPPIAPQSPWGIRALGHLWFILTFIPVQIFSLLVKIKDVFLCHSFAEATTSQEKYKIMATKEPVPPTTTFPLKEETLSKVVATDSLPDLRYVMTPPQSRKIEHAEPNLDLSSLFVENEQPIANQNQVKEVGQEKEIKIETAPQSASKDIVEAVRQVTDVNVEAANKVTKHVQIDVPNDGNCLFYTCAVGIRKKYHDISSIQEKLAWEIDPNILTGDLSKQTHLLKQPAAFLRQQAADFLLANMDDVLIMNALIGAIYEHNPKFERRIAEIEKSINTLLQGLDKLHDESLMQQLKELEGLYQNIEEQRQNLVDTNDIPAYIDKSRQDRFYCDSPHIYALGRLFGIPIKVLINYNEKTPASEKDQITETYNVEATSTPLTIAHIHGNHYMYIDA